MINSFSKDFFIYGIGVVLSKLIQILILPLVTGVFTVAEVGLIELANSLSGVILLVVLLNIDTAVTFYYWDAKGDEDLRKKYVGSALTYILLSALLNGFALILLRPVFERIYFKTSVDGFYLYLVIASILQAVHAYLLKLQRIQKNALLYNVNNILYIVLFYFSLYVFIKLPGGVARYFEAKYIALIFSLFLLVYSSRKLLRISFSPILFRRLSVYALPLIPFSLSNTMMDMADRFFLNKHYGTIEVGVYSIALKLAGIISLFVSAFIMAYGPFSMSIKDKPKAKNVYSTIFQIYVYISLVLILVIQFLSGFILRIFISNPADYINAVPLFVVMATSYFIHSLYSQLSIGLSILKKNKYISYASIFALIINILLNAVLVKRYGMMGAAFSTLASYLIVSIGVYYVNRCFYKIHYNYRFLIALLVFFLISITTYQIYAVYGGALLYALSLTSSVALLLSGFKLIPDIKMVWSAL